jgi:hypothetical protein
MKIKAIDTKYNGYKFRSRLEARWAIFFDSLSIKYEYEKEGFDLNGLKYLPDFWLSEYNCWVEIKPAILKLPNGHVARDGLKITERYVEPVEAFTKCRKLCDLSDNVVLLIGGNPWAKNISEPGEYYQFDYEVIVFYPLSVLHSTDFTQALNKLNFGMNVESMDILNHNTYCSNEAPSLYWFISKKYKEMPNIFKDEQPKCGNVYELVVADRKYYECR